MPNELEVRLERARYNLSQAETKAKAWVKTEQFQRDEITKLEEAISSFPQDDYEVGAVLAFYEDWGNYTYLVTITKISPADGSEYAWWFPNRGSVAFTWETLYTRHLADREFYLVTELTEV